MQTSVNLEDLVASVGDAFVVSDADGQIILWNPAAERMFGYSESEALGNTLDIIIPERLRERHWDGYYKTMETGETKYGNDVLRVPAVNKVGEQLSIAFTVALLFDGAGKVSAIASIIRDETAKFREERELRKRIKELESANETAH